MPSGGLNNVVARSLEDDTLRRGCAVWILWICAWVLAGCGRGPDQSKPPVEPALAAAKVEPTKPEPQPTQPPAAEPAPEPAPDRTRDAPVTFQPDVAVQAELRIAMEELADALRAKDPVAVLAKFSRQASFRYADTRKPEPASQQIAFKRLERELHAKKGDLYQALFGARGVVQYVTGEHWGSWAAVASEEFAPRGVDPKNVKLRFRLEGGAWLVDALFYPAAVRGG